MAETPNYFEMAARAAGTCTPGKESEYFAHIRSLSVRFQKEHAKMSDFLEAIHKAENGGEKNGNRGWGKFQATITHVELNPKMANRAFISYTFLSKDEQGNDTVETDSIRTVPTSAPDGHALYVQAQGLIGHDVMIYKRPDPDFDEEKVNRGRSAKERKVAPKTVFHFEDLGLSSTLAAPQQTPVAEGEDVKAAKNHIWGQLKQAAPNAPQPVLVEAAGAGWAAIGNPSVAPTKEQMNQALSAAFASLNQAAVAAGVAQD